MKPCAVIVAGGQSSRMGRVKTFETVRGRSIIERIMAALVSQCDRLVINANDDGERWRGFNRPVIADLRRDVGTPLAGLHAAMIHAREQGFASVLTVPSDTPFLPADLVVRLAGAGRAAAIAASGGQSHYLTGLWSCGLLPALERAVDQPRKPRLQDWASGCNAASVEWPATPFDPFFNVNTPGELADAERIAAEFGL